MFLFLQCLSVIILFIVIGIVFRKYLHRFIAVKLEKTILIRLICDILSVVTVLTINLSLDLKSRSGTDIISLLSDFIGSFQNYTIVTIVLFPLINKMFKQSVILYKDKFTSVTSTLCIVIPSVIFSASMIIGYSFYKDNSLRLLLENELQIIKSMFAFAGYFALFFFCIIQIFHFIDQITIGKLSEKNVYFKPVQIYLDSLNKRPFITAFFTLLVLYLPYIIASYPVIMMGDSENQIKQVYNSSTLSYYMDYISADVKLTNHHPVTHTLLIKLCLDLGYKITGSVNIGLFLYSTIQFVFVIAVISFFIQLLIKIEISERIVVTTIIYFAFHPIIQNYMFVMTKDIIATAFLLAFILSLYIILVQKQSKIIYIVLFASILGGLLFRNDSVYIIVISLFLSVYFIKGHRKKIIIIAAVTLCFSMIWNLLLLPLLKITPGGKAEMLSIPFQQTARYIRDAKDEITEEEKEAISAVLDYENLAEKYNPNLSDPVKSTYNERSASTSDLKNYLLVWLRMFIKHPGIYLQATLNNKYEYFYPTSKFATIYTYSGSLGMMNKVNNIPEFPGEVFYPDNLNEFRTGYEVLRNSLFKIPIINILYVTATYLWVLIIWFVYCIDKNNKIAIVLMMPLLIMILVLIAGPCNGSYFRYVYPYAVCLPAVILLGLHTIQNDKKGRN